MLKNIFLSSPSLLVLAPAAYTYENMNLYQLTADIAQNGLSETIQDRKDEIRGLIQDDPAVQAFGILALFTLATLTGLAIPALIAGGSMVLYQTASLLKQIDTALQAAATRVDAMNVVTDPKVRRQIATNIVLVGLVIAGGAYQLKEFNAFQDALPSTARASFSELPYWKQARVFETATRLGVSPDVMEFYLTNGASLGS